MSARCSGTNRNARGPSCGSAPISEIGTAALPATSCRSTRDFRVRTRARPRCCRISTLGDARSSAVTQHRTMHYWRLPTSVTIASVTNWALLEHGADRVLFSVRMPADPEGRRQPPNEVVVKNGEGVLGDRLLARRLL